jgi:flagellar export protein FliJ
MSRAWSVLGKLAEQRVLAARRSLQQIDQLIERLDQRVGQVRGLIAENRALQTEKVASRQSIAEVKNLGDFIQRLLLIEQQALQEREVLLSRRQEAQRRLQDAAREEQKMNALDERAAQQAQRAQEKSEQSQMDASALARFNQLRQAPQS